VQTGIKYKLFPEMQFNVDVGWMDWKKWDGLTMTFDRAVPVLQIGKILSPYITVNSLTVPLSFESRWSLKFGWEYSMTDRLRFRLGYEPRKSSVPLNKRSPLLPINNTQLFGAGIGYSFDPNTEIDLGISYIRSKDNIPAGSSTLANQIGVNNAVLNPYAGLDVQTSTKIMLMGINYRTKW
jgi:long-subunit fatty acid transport protein